jgi:hypothetical protein
MSSKLNNSISTGDQRTAGAPNTPSTDTGIKTNLPKYFVETTALIFFSFPLELHIVHRNVKANSLSDALQLPSDSGVAVLGILFEMDPYEGHGHWLEGFLPYHTLPNVSCQRFNFFFRIDL